MSFFASCKYVLIVDFVKYLVKKKKEKSGFPGGSVGKESACQCKRPGFDSWVRKIPWRRKWQSTSVFLSVKSLGQRSLVGYSP